MDVLTVFPVLRGCHALDPHEGGTKDTLAGKTGGEADILDRKGSVFQ